MIYENYFSLYKTSQPPPFRYRKQKPAVVKNKIAKNILITLALGAGGVLVTINPLGAVYFMVQGAVVLCLREVDFKHEIKRLERRGYVALTKTPEGFVIKLLKKANKRLKSIAFENLTLPKNEKWDKKWRLYIFDIPEKNRTARDLLRRKLKNLGMFNIQRSVFAYPYDCREELDFISNHYGINKYTSYSEVN